MVRISQIEKQTIDGYRVCLDEWKNSHQRSRWTVRHFEQFQRLLPQGKILEIGCGTGEDARELIARRYDYTGVDASSEMLAEAQRQNPQPLRGFLNRDFYDLRFPSNQFDGFWAAASYLHAPKDKIDDALQELRKVVRDGGVGFFAMANGRTSEVTIEKETRGGERYRRFIANYEDTEFRDVLGRNGFEITTSEYYRPGSTKWLLYFVKVKKK